MARSAGDGSGEPTRASTGKKNAAVAGRNRFAGMVPVPKGTAGARQRIVKNEQGKMVTAYYAPRAKRDDWKPAKGYAEDDYRRGKDGTMRLAITTRPKSAAGKGRRSTALAKATQKPVRPPERPPAKPQVSSSKPRQRIEYFGNADDVRRGTVRGRVVTLKAPNRPRGKTGGKR